jgi:hypothetical protein
MPAVELLPAGRRSTRGTPPDTMRNGAWREEWGAPGRACGALAPRAPRRWASRRRGEVGLLASGHAGHEHALLQVRGARRRGDAFWQRDGACGGAVAALLAVVGVMRLLLLRVALAARGEGGTLASGLSRPPSRPACPSRSKARTTPLPREACVGERKCCVFQGSAAQPLHGPHGGAGQNRRPPARGSALRGLSIGPALPSSAPPHSPSPLTAPPSFSIPHATHAQIPFVPPENTHITAAVYINAAHSRS